MCGISGIYNPIAIINSRLEESLDLISHRGPDESGQFIGDKCVLGIARLSIVDVAKGHQPCFSESKKIVSVFNGEIYNFSELRKILIKKGHNLVSESDSEIIPHLYEEFGIDFVSKLQGMFAIAIYNAMDNSLLLVRDRLGQKPLWYSNNSGTVMFSSEIKGLIPLGVNLEFDHSCLQEYLTLGYINAPNSAFREVQQVKPGHYAYFCNQNTYSKSYWNPYDISEKQLDFQSALDGSRELLNIAVKDCLVSERPLGVLLSGGVDSSLIAAIAQSHLGNLETFTMGFEQELYDESNTAREISRLIGTKHHEIILKFDTAELLLEVSGFLDSPFADSSIIPTYAISKFARERVVVALGGDGGDEIFGGYDRYRAGLFLSQIRSFSRCEYLSELEVNRFSDSRLSKFVQATIEPTDLRRYLAMVSVLPRARVQRLLGLSNNGLINSSTIEGSWKSDLNLLSAMQVFDLGTYLPGDLLYKSDIASMANGLELRSPFLDHRVVEFGLSIPTKFKMNFSTNKRVLRSLLEEHLPEKFSKLPKKGFGIPREYWLKNSLKPLIYDLLLSNDSFVNTQLDSVEVRKLVSQHMEGINREATIWTLLMLELWGRRWTKK